MSIIQPDSIKTIATSVNISKLSDEAAKTLAPDVEYRLREVVQEALKFAKHAKRTKLTTEDINNALRLRNVEPLYGFGSKDPAKFLRVATHPELMYVRDPELNYHQLIEHPLPKLPRDAGVTAHWLCIDGVQPDVPENMAVEGPPAKRRHLLGAPRPGGRAGGLQDAGAAAAAGMDAAATAAGSADAAAAAATAVAGTAAGRPAPAASGQQVQQQQQLLLGSGVGVTPRAAASAAVQVQLPLRHAVSRELQVYFDKIAGLILAAPASGATAAVAAAAGGGGVGAASWPGMLPPAAAGSSTGSSGGQGDKQAALLKAAFASLAIDPGLQPLAPYFSSFIADGVKQHLASLAVLHRLLQLARALLANPGVHLAPYLQQLLPAVVTCAVTKTLGLSPLEDHWAVRREAAALLAAIAATFAAPHHNLTPRLCRVLAQAWLDGDKPLASKYGAVVGLQALGPQVVRTLLIPHLEPSMSTLICPAMTPAAAAPDATQQQQPPGFLGLHQHQQQQLQRRLQQRQRQQLQLEAWQVYDALVSAVGGAMYDLLVGQVSGQLPLQLVLARSAAQGDGSVGVGGGRWEQQYTRTLLAARRSAGGSGKLKQQGQAQVRGPAGAAAPGATDAGMQQQQQQQTAGTGGTSAGDAIAPAPGNEQGQAAAGRSSNGRLLKGPPGVLAGAAAAAATGADGSSQQSVAEVLGRSWKEDSDVNATLGALLGLFGEDLLPCLPLPQLAAVSL